MKMYEEAIIQLNEQRYSDYRGKGIGGSIKQGYNEFMKPKNLKFNIGLGAFLTLGIPLISVVFKAVRSQLSLAHKKCGALGEGPGYTKCVAREQIRIYSTALQQLNTARSKCGTNINCQNKVDMKIEEMRRKLMIAHREAEESTSQINAAKEENMGYRQVNEAGIMGAVGKKAMNWGGFALGGFVVPAVLYGVFDKMLAPVYQTVKVAFSETERKCAAAKEGPARDMCKSRIKIGALKQKEAALARVVNMCNSKVGTGNSKCMKYQSQLEDVQNQIKAFEDNIEVYQQALRNESMGGRIE